jgi:hypothetical protein
MRDCTFHLQHVVKATSFVSILNSFSLHSFCSPVSLVVAAHSSVVARLGQATGQSGLISHVLVNCALSSPICVARVFYMNHQVDRTLHRVSAGVPRALARLSNGRLLQRSLQQ